MYMSSYKHLVTMDKEHRHPIMGFIIGNKEYKITNMKQKKGNGEVLVSRKFNKKVLATIKNFIRLDLVKNKNYTPKKNIYVTLDLKNEQLGGAAFPVAHPPLACAGRAVALPVDAPVPLYEEPAISYIEQLSADMEYDGEPVIYAAVMHRHRTVGQPYFNDKMALLTEANFGNYRNLLLREHLLHNAYAHNGISDIRTLQLIIGADYRGLQIIHSLAHVYDSVYMHAPGSQAYINNMEFLADYDALIGAANERQRQAKSCLYITLNHRAGDFLVQDARGFVTPYTIKAEAMAGKERQYGRCRPGLLPNFHRQICDEDHSAHPLGHTRSLPNE